MKRFLTISVASLVASIAATSLSSTARADEAPLPASPAPSLSGEGASSIAQQDRATGSDVIKPFKSFGLEVNPLAAAIGRYSIQAEWLPAVHHAIVVNPHFDHVSPTLAAQNGASYSESFTGFGGELGYRYYTGTKGPTGFFIGPSVMAAHYSTSVEGQSGPSFSSYGAAIDIGGQAMVGPGILIGAGFGLQYTKSSLDGSTDGLPLTAAIIAGEGVRPRFLLTVGYAF